MISFEMFEELVKLLEDSYNECERFNKGMTDLLGDDSSVMYYNNYENVCKHFIKILELNGESHEGADWFVYEGLDQIKRGGTEFESDGKKYIIENLRDYYDYLIDLNIDKIKAEEKDMK